MKTSINLSAILSCLFLTIILGFTPLSGSNQQQVDIKKSIDKEVVKLDIDNVKLKQPDLVLLSNIYKLNKDIKNFEKSVKTLKEDIKQQNLVFSDKDSTFVKADSNVYVKRKSWVRRTIEKLGINK